MAALQQATLFEAMLNIITQKNRFLRNGFYILTRVWTTSELPSKILIYSLNAIVYVKLFINVINMLAHGFLGNA